MIQGTSQHDTAVSALTHACRHLLPAITALGYEAYLVGGCVRDTLMQYPVRDVDIATNCPPKILQEHFSIQADISRNMDITVMLLQSNGFTYEVAQFRTPQDNSPFTAPQALQKDLEGRDFTINALAMNAEQNIIDPFGGLKDIQTQTIRGVVSPHKRFTEDPIRILRAVRFAVKYNFSIEPATQTAAQACKELLSHIAPERIHQEITALTHLGGKAFAQGLQMLHELGLLDVILPEVSALNTAPHAEEHHPEGNAFAHTLTSIALCPSQSTVVLLALLCHDLGKPVTLTYKRGNPAYHRHEHAAVPIIESLGKRLRWSNELLAHVLFTAKHHMRFHAIPHMAPHKTFALMESPYFATLHTVALYDAKSRLHAFNPTDWQAIEDTLASLKKRFTGRNSPLALLTGDYVMQVTGLASGALLGRVMAKTKEWILDNNISDIGEIQARLRQLAQSMKNA